MKSKKVQTPWYLRELWSENTDDALHCFGLALLPLLLGLVAIFAFTSFLIGVALLVEAVAAIAAGVAILRRAKWGWTVAVAVFGVSGGFVLLSSLDEGIGGVLAGLLHLSPFFYYWMKRKEVFKG